MINGRYLLSIFWPTLVGIGVGIIVVALQLKGVNFQKTTFLSPLGEILGVTAETDSNKEVIGFLPYWLMKDAKSPFSQLDTIVYFSISLDDRGQVKTKENTQEAEMGWYTLHKESTQNLLGQLRQHRKKTILAVTAFDNEKIDNLISDSKVKQQAIEAIAEEVKESKFDGVNVDFEYSLKDHFRDDSGLLLAQFIADLKKRLKKDNFKALVSVDIYVNGIINDKPYDLKALNQTADQIIIMAYDFHIPSSDAGPIAPLRTGDDSRSIIEGIQAAIKKEAAMEKLVLGIPLYGYEWQTYSSDFKAQTVEDSGVLATYKRINELIKDKGIETMWDEGSLSPWFSYKVGRQIRQVYYDNEESISLKLQLVDQLKMKGIAFWALGYEGNELQIWDMVGNWQKRSKE
ncbi:hypothetical protein A2160_03610 [Candidatus Beckwithbacteria bacterium RBG_13_42_9]|uniref:GH18 domain-containing protein n=1 Tax=Candidatus Beckwithbacteria bacterium RBG_13_42_9 TaxID=1797457 RepID=A0A1F5E8J7_9BACT|nr:MAG: hypothetical protein A2160_03610 [Candidatus Beckwithbacteria bacterium RBG_13_42_9]